MIANTNVEIEQAYIARIFHPASLKKGIILPKTSNQTPKN
jgi:hypothetical protein